MADLTEAWCRRWQINDTSMGTTLVIVGDNGCAKTHTAKKVASYIRAATDKAFDTRMWGENRKPSTTYINWPEACAEFAEKRYGLQEDAISVDSLILDDVGAEVDAWGNAKDRLCQIMTRRDRRFTLITTNVLPANWAVEFGSRVEDRLLRHSVVHNLEGVVPFSAWKAENP